ncbi:MAG: peptidoglycan DD-metalloendopeptidase family protein [Xenococcus sp. (in: cyanobacteria)]
MITITAGKDTWLKKEFAQASELSDSKKHFVSKGTEYQIIQAFPQEAYLEIVLAWGQGTWKIFNEHWEGLDNLEYSILFDRPFPEVQISSPYQTYSNPIMGEVKVTSGFMEPRGHGYKSRSRLAIFRDRSLKKVSPGNYNIGFDYSVGFGADVICMYGGEVVKAGKEGGYGYRIHVKLDREFKYQGQTYTVFQAYAHCSTLFFAKGDRVTQGDTLGLEAGQGSSSPYNYPTHVDLDTYIYIGKEQVSINFELLATDEIPQSSDRWEIALDNCPTSGCSLITAKAEGLPRAGIASSHLIAKKDLTNLSPTRLQAFRQASLKFDISLAVTVAVASRETHLGTVLGIGGNKPGWGDNNHGFGVMQVDRRYHTIQGKDDPFSQEHIEQALSIFANYRSQLLQKHPSWSDSYILKGTCAAYNSGVANVQTISGMDIGTTGNDYSNDVIARALFFKQHID